jgi:hypothetical protein
MKVAIMQPYFFPYLGYFQLIESVDNFIFYDDVNFIKKGWVNRNNILVNNEKKLLTVPLQKASQNKIINEVLLNINLKWIEKFLRTLKFTYKKAPYFTDTFEIIKKVFTYPNDNICDLNIEGIKEISKYLGINTKFEKSSTKYVNSKFLKKDKRIIEILNQCNSKVYINAVGGRSLYNKNHFAENGINLLFLKPLDFRYKQFSNRFVSNLSIIDVLMFNSKEEILNFLKKSTLS